MGALGSIFLDCLSGCLLCFFPMEEKPQVSLEEMIRRKRSGAARTSQFDHILYSRKGHGNQNLLPRPFVYFEYKFLFIHFFVLSLLEKIVYRKEVFEEGSLSFFNRLLISLRKGYQFFCQLIPLWIRIRIRVVKF